MAGDDDLPSFARRPPRRSRAAVLSASLLAALLLGLVAGRWYAASRRGTALRERAGQGAAPASESPSVLAVEAIQRIEGLSQALEAYRKDRGTLPAGSWVDAYAELSGKYFSPARFPRRDPWNQAIRYVTSSDRTVFLLLSPGEDGIYQVDDRTLSEMLSRRCQVERRAFGEGFGTDVVSCNGLLVSAPAVAGGAAPGP